MVSVVISSSLEPFIAMLLETTPFTFPVAIVGNEDLLMDSPPDFLNLFDGSFFFDFGPGGVKLLEFWRFGLD